MKNIIKKSLEKACSYQEFRNLVSKLITENKSTGNEQSEVLSHYSLLNDKRMKRIDKTIKITAETLATINNIKTNLIFLVLTEGWCGDSAQTLPVINKIATLTTKIELKILLRDTNEDLMQHFLTNGAKSIPKLIILEKKNLKVLNSWGPSPNNLRKIVIAYKKEKGTLDDEFKKNIQVWYNKDKGISTQKEIASLLNIFENAN
ncbi:MAG: thioredoxin family protein [Flavobacteriaceae bacterium]|nr:thioredoxin family protein [Flavobacteriaceae bacterium]